jgi:hypothetical protein
MEENHIDLELDFEFLHELRITRNEIDYRGMTVSKDSWKKLELKVNFIINYLRVA